MELSPSLYVAIPLLASCAIVYTTTGNRKLPPSPPKLPILGHILSIPQTLAWDTFAAWRKQYGPVFFLELLGRPVLVINSVEAARDLMEKKGANFSDRPRSPVFNIIGWDNTVPMMTYDHSQFRKQRRLMQEHLGSSAVRSYDGILEDRIQRFLHRLQLYPDQFCQEIHGHVASVLVEVVYGHSVSGNPVQDNLIAENERVMRLTALCGAIGATLLDIFPFLRYLPVPGVSVKQKALEAAEAFQAAFTLPFEEAKSKKIDGVTTPSIMSRILDDYDDLRSISREEDTNLKHFAGTFYNAATDSTRTVMTMFFLQMVLNQDVQKRAQKEIDSVVGFDRLPSSRDRPSIKYLDCILKEVLRIHPPAPLGVPHASIQTDEYQGWTIPAGSLIMPNIWHMMRDEKLFPDPEKFDPGRFASGEDKTREESVSPVFGFGRRLCPGRAFAESTIWLTMANVLATFDLLPPTDPTTGKEVYPVPEFENGSVYFVKPFKCRLVPRKERIALVAPDA